MLGVFHLVSLQAFFSASSLWSFSLRSVLVTSRASLINDSDKSYFGEEAFILAQGGYSLSEKGRLGAGA